jgi:flagellin-like hook-associated protein FlgL
MRVTTYTSNAQFIQQVNALKLEQNNLSRQISTGQKIHGPEEDASAVARVSAASTEKSRIQAFANNINRAETIANLSLESLQVFKEIGDSASNLALTNDGLTSSMDLLSKEADLRQLIEQGIHSLNTKFGDDYLFAGANTSERPFETLRYTEYLEDADGNFVDLSGELIGPGDPPVAAVMRDTSGAIVFDTVESPSGNPISEGTYLDPTTGNQTDAAGVPLAGPIQIDAGIDFNTGELVGLNATTGAFEPILDADGNVIIPQNPDPSGTGVITLTRAIPDKYIGEVYAVTYTGSVDRSDDVRFRVAENSQVDPFSRGAQNAGYAEVLNNMVALRDTLLNEDLDAVSEHADALESTRSNVNNGIVELAVKVNGIKTLERINVGRFHQLENNISDLMDADLAETIVQLNRMQTAYEATLSSGARILNLSILDYLR